MAVSQGLALLVALVFVGCHVLSEAASVANHDNQVSGGSINMQFLASDSAFHLPVTASKFASPVSREFWSKDCGIVPTAGFNLTDEEQALLPHICWRSELVSGFSKATPAATVGGVKRGIPPGVQCNPVQWCEKDGGACATVCERGTVFVEPWLEHALRTQLQLSRRVPFCYATMLGTHNSGITLADGYGALDPYFQKYFEWIRWASKADQLQTNDQVLSLTDQLNLGVRMIELDTHWFQGDFKIAHCGGFHSFFNTLIKGINLVAKLLHHNIRWDTETIGCDPSLSSIPTGEQRSLELAMEEVRAWMAAPANELEFVVLFFDDQKDLHEWGLIPLLLERITQYFPAASIYSPADHGYRGATNWPSMDEMMAAGKRVLLLSGIDYGSSMDALIFDKGKPVCNFFEPNLTTYIASPTCIVNDYPHQKHIKGKGLTQAGQLYRMTTCEITYGPLNCDFTFRGSNEPLLDETTLPDVTACGVNVPSPDALTPQRSASTIWTWAPGHPLHPQDDVRLVEVLYPKEHALRGWKRQAGDALKRWWRRVRRHLLVFWGPTGTNCSVVSASDGRWRVVSCSAVLPTACRSDDATTNGDESIAPHAHLTTVPLWAVQEGDRGSCPGDYSHEVPRTAKENMHLQIALVAAGIQEAWLPVYGPEWALP